MYLGSVYVYAFLGNLWSRQSKILAPDGAASDEFGVSVSVYGTAAMTGAWKDDGKASDAGIIYI
jgi:hypothetical protein